MTRDAKEKKERTEAYKTQVMKNSRETMGITGNLDSHLHIDEREGGGGKKEKGRG